MFKYPFKSLIVIICTGMLFTQCRSKTKIEITEDLVSKLDTVNFSNLRNRTVLCRSVGGPFSLRYLVRNYSESKCLSYSVDYNIIFNRVSQINRGLVHETCNSDYLDSLQLVSAVETTAHYKLQLLQVDSLGNVYINPFNYERPLLMRSADQSNVVNHSIYKPFKGNWFIRL